MLVNPAAALSGLVAEALDIYNKAITTVHVRIARFFGGDTLFANGDIEPKYDLLIWPSPLTIGNATREG
ncbi:hypothetical protein BC938DRAFT_476517 [Jimgerdemannia flammicorona]|uniref:Uncharacterized protein n=1 Tax=Jimgerdemannia flammicorona TaxID=994334 RepID=A0A433PGJ1_9FUNG|nr:hypothetical protein BC938DRAFT_476517 [Jimgerdemannia flammicorona]